MERPNKIVFLERIPHGVTISSWEKFQWIFKSNHAIFITNIYLYTYIFLTLKHGTYKIPICKIHCMLLLRENRYIVLIFLFFFTKIFLSHRNPLIELYADGST